jgi:hypothetical protein
MDAELLFDDTLEDGPLPAPRDSDTRRRLVEQRFVHGLLRYLHSGDGPSREARIQAILERLPPAAARVSRRPGWLLPTAAAALLVAVAGALVGPLLSPTPQIRAEVGRVLAGLDAPGVRQYRVDVVLSRDAASGERWIRARYLVHVGSGGRFRLEGDGLLGPVTVGCDGEVLWCQPSLELLRWSRGYAPRHRLGTLLRPGPLRAGDLELSAVVRRLAERAEQAVVSDVVAPPGHPAARRIEAQNLGDFRGSDLVSAALEAERETGRLTWLEVVSRRGRWVKSIELRLLPGGSKRPPTEVDFARPW